MKRNGCPVLAPYDNVCGNEPCGDVAARNDQGRLRGRISGGTRLWCLGGDGGTECRDKWRRIVLDADRLRGAPCCALTGGAYGRDWLAGIEDLGPEQPRLCRRITRSEDVVHVGHLARSRSVEPANHASRHCGTQHDGVQHAGAHDVCRVPRAARHFLFRVHARNARTDDRELCGGIPGRRVERR